MPITNMKAIQTVTVGAGGAPSIEFTAIPQTYTDLYILLSARSDESGSNVTNLRWTFNNSTSGYSGVELYGQTNNNSVGSGNGGTTSSYIQIGYANAPLNTSSAFSNTMVYIPNYTSSNNKLLSLDSAQSTNGGVAYIDTGAGLWSNSAAITSIKITPLAVNFVQNSTATLYGVTNTIASGAKAYGGTVTEDSTYFYHTFTNSGTFTPTQSITADILVLAGGGGGGSAVSGAGGYGGGGAGELALMSNQNLTAQNYTVTTGGGGARGSITTDATAGSSSIFGAIKTSVGGAGGRSITANGLSGACGGGGGGGDPITTGGTGTVHTNGGAGNNQAPNYGGGGGGGVTVAGSNATSTTGGNGGNGSSAYSSWGLATLTGQNVNGTYWYGGGGGGGTFGSGGTNGTGGNGGGGNGCGNGTNTSTAGLVASGGGGGGAGSSSGLYSIASAGGSGVVIVRYAK